MPSIPTRLDALEAAVAQEKARRLAILVAIHTWLTAEVTDPPTNPVWIAFEEFLADRIAEGP